MIPLLLACLLLMKAVSSQTIPQITAVNPVIQGHFEDCDPPSHQTTFFDLEQGESPDVTCSIAQSRTALYSVEVFTANDPSQNAQMLKVVIVPVGMELKLQFWVKYGSDSSPYPLDEYHALFATYTTQGIQQDDTLIHTPTDDVAITRAPPTVLPFLGWYRYEGIFTPELPDSSIGDYVQLNLKLVFQHAQTVAIESTWLDEYQLGFSAAFVIGDPQFVGLRQQSYQVHGIADTVYNLVSSQSTQINARFVFLDQGNCPIFNGTPATNCWAHPGSYLGEIAVQQVVNDFNNKLKMVSGSAQKGFALVELNGRVMQVNDTYSDGPLFEVTFVSSHVIKVVTSDFAFTFDNSDQFINQAVTVTKPLSKINAHGLFGQTHKLITYPTSIKYIAGEVDDYVILENDLFGNTFVYNRFNITD